MDKNSWWLTWDEWLKIVLVIALLYLFAFWPLIQKALTP